MITRARVCIPLLALVASLPVQAGSPERGYLLYQTYCHHCHATEVHDRVHSRASTWKELVRLVAMWQEAMGLGWSGEDVRDVASWLDWRFYRLVDAPGPR